MATYVYQCPNCGETNPPNARFCGNCQTQLSSNPPASNVGMTPPSTPQVNPLHTMPAFSERASTGKKLWGGAAIIWGALLIIGGTVEITEGDIDMALATLISGALPAFGGFAMIRNQNLLGMTPGIATIIVTVLGFILFAIGVSTIDDISPP